MKNKLPCLDGLRAISILFVLFSHILPTLDRPVAPWMLFLFARGDLGVFVFFILSGFLITYLLQREYDATGTISLRDFYLRRVLRIFPAFYTYLGVLAILTLLGCISIELAHFLDAGFFLWNYKHIWDTAGGQGWWYLGHFWTLSLEEQFYLLWPLTLLLLKVRRAAWLALALIILMPLIRLVSYFLFPQWRGQLIMMIHTGADSLMLGCLLALVMKHPKMGEIWDSFASPFWPIFAALFVWLISPLITIMLPGHYEGGYTTTLGRTLNGLCIIFIIAWLLKYPESPGGRFLNSKVISHIGVLSYSLYLWQQLFLTKLNTTWTGRFPYNIGCAYLAAVSSHYLIERPFLKMKQYLAQRPALKTSADNRLRS